jgi:hypothetical protein
MSTRLEVLRVTLAVDFRVNHWKRVRICSTPATLTAGLKLRTDTIDNFVIHIQGLMVEFYVETK